MRWLADLADEQLSQVRRGESDFVGQPVKGPTFLEMPIDQVLHPERGRVQLEARRGGPGRCAHNGQDQVVDDQAEADAGILVTAGDLPDQLAEGVTDVRPLDVQHLTQNVERQLGLAPRHLNEVDCCEVEVVATGPTRQVVLDPRWYSEQMARLKSVCLAACPPSGHAMELEIELPNRVPMGLDKELLRHPLLTGVDKTAFRVLEIRVKPGPKTTRSTQSHLKIVSIVPNIGNV